MPVTTITNSNQTYLFVTKKSEEALSFNEHHFTFDPRLQPEWGNRTSARGYRIMHACRLASSRNSNENINGKVSKEVIKFHPETIDS